MAIDIRADATCNLGTLISASINDDYIQGSGLIKTSGSCEISGIVTPSVGDEVIFSYTKSGVTRKIPRKLRVLSSFADPFRRTTSISLGCKLTYLQDLTDPINWEALDDPENASRTEDEQEIVTIPIYASSVMDKCLTELGITASSNPLTNAFSIPEFDFSGGYVNILSDLLVSESYCGYLDVNEVLQVFSLDQEGGTGPVLTKDEIIDIGPINVGQLPGEAVTVSYSTLKLKQPDGGGNDAADAVSGNDWEYTYSSTKGSVGISYTDNNGNQAIQEYNTFKTTETYTKYFVLELTNGEKTRLVESRETTERESSINAMGAVASARLSNGGSFNSYQLFKQTKETYIYDVKTGYEVYRRRWTYGSPEYISSGAPVPWAFGPDEFVDPAVSPGMGQGSFYAGGYIDLADEKVYSKTIEESALVPGYTSSTMSITETYGTLSQTIVGQQAIAEARDSFQTVEQVEDFLKYYVYGINGLYLLDRSVNISESGVRQIAPSAAAINDAKNADESGDPSNGYRTDSKSELELALGSTTAQRRIEFSMPYAPDDIFIKNPGPPVTYAAQHSDAAQKAQKYGRVQNKLLLGGRSGMNLQLPPEKLPIAPFEAFVVQAGGLSGLYRTNGTAWTIDPTGVIVSTDALFWGAIGGTGDFWFPVAPGIVTLPSTPATEDTSPEAIIGTVPTVGTSPQNTLNAAFPGAANGDGVQDQTNDNFWVYDGSQWENVGPTPGPTIAASAVVPVWNETIIAIATVKSKISVQSFNYALQLLTEADPIVSFAGVAVRKSKSMKPSTVSINLVAELPSVSSGSSNFVPSTAVDVKAEQVAVSSGKSIFIDDININFAILDLINAGPPRTIISPPTGQITISRSSPIIYTGASVSVLNADISIGVPSLNSQLTVGTGTIAPELGSSSATTYSGWSLIQNGTVDDANIGFSGWGFTFTLDNIGYTGAFIGSNGYLTFGSGSSSYSNLSASNPALPKLHFFPGDRSYQRVYTKTGKLSVGGPKFAAIRWEGGDGTSGTPGSSNVIVEIRFYEAIPSSSQFIEVRFGNMTVTSTFMLANASTAYASANNSANSSWVFAGNSTGTSWTLTSNRKVELQI